MWALPYRGRRNGYDRLSPQRMGKQMAYFDENTTEWPEQLGKVIGDAFSALVFISVVVLMITIILR